MTKDDIFRLFNEHFIEDKDPNSYESIMTPKLDKIEKELLNNYELAKECFRDCSALFFTECYGDSVIDSILEHFHKEGRSKELYDILRKNIVKKSCSDDKKAMKAIKELDQSIYK